MDLSTFLNHRRPDWRRLEEILARVEGSGLATLDDDAGRRVWPPLSPHRLRPQPGPDVRQRRGDGAVPQRPGRPLLPRHLLENQGRLPAPSCVTSSSASRRCSAATCGYFLLATALLAVGTVFGFLASYFDPDVARAYLLPDMHDDSAAARRDRSNRQRGIWPRSPVSCSRTTSP